MTEPAGPGPDDQAPVTVRDLARWAETGQRFAMLTCYDALTAEILDDAGVPVLLVGDSLGMVVQGHDSTVPVTVDHVAHHTAAVARGARRAMVVADMPFLAHAPSPAHGVEAARRLLQSGAAAVKLEGAAPAALDVVERLSGAGAAVMGHVGLTPQHVHRLGGHRVQGRDRASAARLVDDALALQEAGCFALVLECVPVEVAAEIVEAVAVPTIGIGAGPATDGQVLVVDDLLGRTGGPRPRFAEPYADLRSITAEAASRFVADVASGTYPAERHTYPG